MADYASSTGTPKMDVRATPAPSGAGQRSEAPPAAPANNAPVATAPVVPVAKQLTDSVFPRQISDASTSAFPPGYGQRPEVKAARAAAKQARLANQAARQAAPRQDQPGQPSGAIAPFAPSPLVSRDAAMREPTNFFPMKTTLG